MILRTVFRMAWVVTASVIAALVALAVLLALGAVWVGDELKAAAPHDPVLQQGAPVFGIVLFASTVTPALTALPAVVAVVAARCCVSARGCITCWREGRHSPWCRCWLRRKAPT